MYNLKQIPEDFIVKEISDVKIKEQGKYLYFKLTKKNRNTLDVIQEIARQLHLPEKQIGFAGNKDKRAVTEQVCSIVDVSRERLLKANIDNAKLEFEGYGNTPISLGDLKGNHFEIIVRNLENASVQKISYCENYFDEQRFSRNNAKIGQHLIKKDFGEAIKLINNQKSNDYLPKHKNDFVGALKELSLRLLRIYVNAYQSYLWNETLAEYLKRKRKVIKEVPYSVGTLFFVEEDASMAELNIPLIGFDSEEINDEEINKIIQELMKKENILPHDFIIKQIPQFTLEGEMRKAFVEVKELIIGEMENDELNPGKKKTKITFSLPKGSYATMVIRKIIQEQIGNQI